MDPLSLLKHNTLTNINLDYSTLTWTWPMAAPDDSLDKTSKHIDIIISGCITNVQQNAPMQKIVIGCMPSKVKMGHVCHCDAGKMLNRPTSNEERTNKKWVLRLSSEYKSRTFSLLGLELLRREKPFVVTKFRVS